MNLIEKIDAGIALTNEEKNKFLKLLAKSMLPKGCIGESLNGGIMYVIHQVSAIPTHEIILSEPKEPLTIGDKIRESNESLAQELIKNETCYWCIAKDDCIDKEIRCATYKMKLAHLNQPYAE